MMILLYLGIVLAAFAEDAPIFEMKLLLLLVGAILIGIVQTNYDGLRERIKKLEEKVKGGE